MGQFVAVGNCVLDTILSVPHFPGEDDKLRASNITRRRGGNAPNTVDVLQQLFASDDEADRTIGLNLIVVLPNRASPAVQEIQRSLGSGKAITKSIYREDYFEASSSYIIKNLATDSRTIISYNSLQDMNFEEFTQIAGSFGNEAVWYHFEGRIPDVTLNCIRYLRKSAPDVKISVEIEKFPREGLEELVPEADVIFYSKIWAVGNGYKDAEACLRAQAKLAPSALLLCCTWGMQGASVFEPATEAYYHRAAWVSKDSQVVDTIGAGDTFIAGMLYSYLAPNNNWPVSQKLEFANELAGRKVVQEGFAGLGGLVHRGLQQ
ncbi:putative PfkB family kinase [Microthyrium microscopicum]|uniref:Putative PfkB family kinase n=1 Tax=Microthyrium microscopicum TaxID=703497 RepID=A0A6A6U3U9_9PEZI|nr:putative PfkB family kinase [Microthyrium microscopicum]